MKHVREFKLTEETGWTDPLYSPQPQAQELARQFLIGLNKGQYKAEVPPNFKEPDTMEDDGNFKDKVDVKIKYSEYSLSFYVSWSYRVEAGMKSPTPHELPDDPDICILTYMDITKLYLYDGEGNESEISVTKEINKLSVTYLEDFVNVDEIDF